MRMAHRSLRSQMCAPRNLPMRSLVGCRRAKKDTFYGTNQSKQGLRCQRTGQLVISLRHACSIPSEGSVTNNPLQRPAGYAVTTASLRLHPGLHSVVPQPDPTYMSPFVHSPNSAPPPCNVSLQRGTKQGSQYCYRSLHFHHQGFMPLPINAAT